MKAEVQRSIYKKSIYKIMYLFAYAGCTALPFGGAGTLFALGLPKISSTHNLYMPSWLMLSVITVFLLVCGLAGLICKRLLPLQDIGNGLYVGSICAASAFVVMPFAIWVVNFLPL